MFSNTALDADGQVTCGSLYWIANYWCYDSICDTAADPNCANPDNCSESQDPFCGENCNGNQCCNDPNGQVGEPIALASGAEELTRTDLTLGSLYPITVERRYNSRSAYNSPLGHGWALSVDKRLYTYPDGSVTIRKEGGGKTRFLWDGVAGEYASFLRRYPSTKKSLSPFCVYDPALGGYVCSTIDSDVAPATPRDKSETLTRNADGTYTLTNKTGEREDYDASGRIAVRTASNGNSQVFTYEAVYRHPLIGLLPTNLDQNNPVIVAYDYRLSRIEEKNAAGSLTGARVAFHYESGTGWLSDITDSAGRTITYTHDSIGNLTGVSGPHGTGAYGYQNSVNRRLLTNINEGQGEYVNTYDSYGRVVKQTHGTGEINVAYTEARKKSTATTAIKDQSGTTLNTQTRTVQFDTSGQPVKVTNTFGNITTYVRDSNTWVLQEGRKDIASGVTTTTAYIYDSKGNMLTKTEAQGTSIEKTTTWTYDSVFSKVLTETVKSVVNPAQNKVTTNTYDSNTSNLLSVNEAGLLGDGTAYSYTTSYAYDSNGRVMSIDGPRTDVNDVTTYAYDPTTGFLTSTTQPLIGSTTYSSFDPLGNPQTVTDPNGNATTYTYDAIGRVLTVKAAGDTSATQYFYVSGGCTSCGGGGANKIDHITLPEGNTIWYTYDNMGNLSMIKDSLNNTINYTYDSEGNRLTEQIKDNAGTLRKSLSYSYDALNRLSKITNPDNTYTQYGYDSRGNRLSAKDPKGNTTTYSYDALNRLTSTVQPGTITTSYGYNSNGNLTSVTDANNNATIYKFSDTGRVYQTISPDTGTTTYSYDPAGNMISKTDAKGVTISYVYDALNRLTKIDFPTDTDIVYSYDSCVNGKGHLCSMTDASGTTVYEYSVKGQTKKETKTIDSIQYVTQYTYDQNDNLKTMTYPSGRVIAYNYSSDKVISVLNNAANLATNVNYKPFGGISSLTYGNGIVGAITYDNQYRVASITAGTVMNLSYSQYDANSNITVITNNLDPTKNKAFAYDVLDRLSTATASGIWGSLAWTYDGVGNRQTEGSTVYSYAPSTNKVTGAGGTSFGYDNNGNTTSQAARSYTYNQNQRLIQVVDGAMTAGYSYNGNGQRVKKVVNGTTTIFHYNRDGQIIAESDATGATTAEYVYVNNAPLANIEGNSVYFYHTDRLSTPQKMTDGTGVVVWSAEYKPFGEATIAVSTITNNLRFPGQYLDAETALHYNYYRDYNPALGRYPQADPIGLIPQGPRGGLNHLYVYVWDNPLNWTDPKGLARFPLTPPSGCVYYKKKCQQKCPPDQYACKVYKCCQTFGDDPTANCIRGCLIAFDQRNCANLTGEAQNHCRQLAHWDCYDRCLGHGMGASGLLTGPPTECQDAMNAVGGMGFGQ